MENRVTRMKINKNAQKHIDAYFDYKYKTGPEAKNRPKLTSSSDMVPKEERFGARVDERVQQRALGYQNSRMIKGKGAKENRVAKRGRGAQREMDLDEGRLVGSDGEELSALELFNQPHKYGGGGYGGGHKPKAIGYGRVPAKAKRGTKATGRTGARGKGRTPGALAGRVRGKINRRRK